MHSYSPLFQTIYDEQQQSSKLGRGTHYSILRAITWKDENLNTLPRAKYLDFAVIWDEDHDDRVISVLEKMYIEGYLSIGTLFGERKAVFSFVLHDDFKTSDFKQIYSNVDKILGSYEEDTWFIRMDYLTYVEDEDGYVQDSEVINIIQDSNENVEKYLKDISKKWNLGLKSI